MTEQELRRYKVISHWMESSITGVEAAAKLGLSYRQVLRLKRKFLRKVLLVLSTKTEAGNLHMHYQIV